MYKNILKIYIFCKKKKKNVYWILIQTYIYIILYYIISIHFECNRNIIYVIMCVYVSVCSMCVFVCVYGYIIFFCIGDILQSQPFI